MTGRLFARRPQDPPPVAQMLGLVALTGLLGLVLMPWIWALVSSFKPRAEIMSTGFLPSVWIVDNYVALFRDTLYLRWLFNSAVVSVSAAVLGMALSAMAGYAFAKFRFASQPNSGMTVVKGGIETDAITIQNSTSRPTKRNLAKA